MAPTTDKKKPTHTHITHNWVGLELVNFDPSHIWLT